LTLKLAAFILNTFQSKSVINGSKPKTVISATKTAKNNPQCFKRAAVGKAGTRLDKPESALLLETKAPNVSNSIK
tara:strand:+ start:281 stop:505 length:225 start_codon:yes stop_codon:yes gene_type:complete